MVTARGLKTNAKVFGLLTLLTGIFLGAGYLIGGTGGMAVALVLAGAMNFLSYWFSDRIVLRVYGAEEVTEEENPGLHRTVEELAGNAGIPKPKIYRNSMEAPNAFATGRSPEKGVVCVTDGFMDNLDREEVAGVLAHEIAHIKNRDTLINAVVATMAGAVAVMAELAFWGAMFGGDEDMGDAVGALAFMIVTPVIATIIRLAISRKMEFRADSDAVRIHGQGEHLGSALEKIHRTNERSGYHASRIQEAGASLFIENPFSGEKLTKYFSTHPPLEERLENIGNTRVE